MRNEKNLGPTKNPIKKRLLLGDLNVGFLREDVLYGVLDPIDQGGNADCAILVYGSKDGLIYQDASIFGYVPNVKEND